MAKVDSSFPVNNLEELVNSSTSKWITISGTALEASIPEITGQIVDKLFISERSKESTTPGQWCRHLKLAIFITFS